MRERGAISLAFPPNDLCDDYFTTSVLSAYFFITARRRGGTAHSRIQIYPLKVPNRNKIFPETSTTLSVDRRSSFFALYNISHLCGMWEWDGAKRVNQISPRLGLLP